MLRITEVTQIIKKHRIAAGLGGAVLIVAAIAWQSQQSAPAVVSTDALPLVTTTTAAAYAGSEELTFVGSVRAFTEAVITSERSGRVTSVNGTLGQTVPAGYVLATLENASERAAVTQAEGSYEAALAAAQQSTISVSEAQNSLKAAENSLRNTVSGAYTTVNGVVRNNIDTFYSDGDNRVPGLKLEGKGQTAFLNDERVAYQTILPNWQLTVSSATGESLDEAVATSIATIDRTIAWIDVFITLFNEQDQVGRYTDAELQTFSSTFNGLRSNLLGTRTSLQTGLAAYANAKEQVSRAELGATGGTTSAADAQVKQALGALQAAQSNLAKTILRTPISGTLNVLDVRTGDFVGAQVPVARVANNSALEIVTYVGDKEIASFTVGETVTINNSIEGVVTAIAPAVDPATKKTEVRIATESADIKNGDTVTISKAVTAPTTATIIIPITAVKFTLEDGEVFLVEDNTLVSRPVDVGVVRGGSVEILSGLSANDAFVVDARGLLAGTKVEVAQ